MAPDLASVLERISRRAQRGVSEARKRRKYAVRGPYTAVEIELFRALLDIERVTTDALRDMSHQIESADCA